MSQSWGRSPANRLSFCPSLVTYSWGEGEVLGAGSSVLGAEHLSVVDVPLSVHNCSRQNGA